MVEFKVIDCDDNKNTFSIFVHANESNEPLLRILMMQDLIGKVALFFEHSVYKPDDQVKIFDVDGIIYQAHVRWIPNVSVQQIRSNL